MNEAEMIRNGSILLNIVLIYITMRTRVIIGPKYWLSVVKAIGFRFRHPMNSHRLYNSQWVETEVVDSQTLVDFDRKSNQTPVTLDEAHRYNSESIFKNYFFREGSMENFDPLKIGDKTLNIIKRAGFANNKYLDYKEDRLRRYFATKLLTVDHFNKYMLILGVGIGVCVYFLYNMNTFAQNAQALYDQWYPILQQQFENAPRLVPAGQDLVKGITGQ